MGFEAKSIRLYDLKEYALEFYDNTISYNNIANILSNKIRNKKKSIIKYKKNENIEKSPFAKNG